MSEARRTIRQTVSRTVMSLVVATMALAACSGSDDPSDAAAASTAVSSTVATASRPVPTVPPATLEGQLAAGDDGVINASPTIVATSAPLPGSESGDPPAPTTAPPTTELLGDPQPIPGSTGPPPPPTAVPPPPACDRLAEQNVDGIVGEAGGAPPVTAVVSDSVCRYTAGTIVAEVHFVPQSVVRDDWYRRSGIEPVGEVSGEAVGFGSFIPPGAAGADGYTIALVGGDDGVIVAVRGTEDARSVAGRMAIFANQAG